MTNAKGFVLNDDIYLLNHSVGRPLANTRQLWEERFLQPWEAAGSDVWPSWMTMLDEFRDSVARLIGGTRDEVCPQVNLSSALTKVIPALCIPEHRRAIGYTAHDFPTMGFVLQQAVQSGFELQQMPESQTGLEMDHWEQMMTPDVGLVLISHVHSNYGRQVPVAEICALARDRGALTVVDVAQSAGVVPIDVKDWGADVVIGSSVKWLCGGPGAGFMWVSSERLPECAPTDVGWFSHSDPFEFDINHFDYATDALRFMGGTPSIQPYVVATNSIDHLLEIGVPKIRAHNLALTDLLIASIPDHARVTPVDAEQRGGTCVVQLNDTAQAKVSAALDKARVAYDVRPTGIRLSPHIYNTAEEIEVVVSCLKQGLKR